MTILVTGGAGYIGSHTCIELISAGYDIVVANILPDVIVPLTKLVPGFLKPGGCYITSGILATRESEVRDALEKSGFKNIETTPMGEWVSICSTI